jgi:hypothetical protein
MTCCTPEYVAPGLIKSGILTPVARSLFGIQRGGELHCVRGFAVACGHSYDAQIKSLFLTRFQREGSAGYVHRAGSFPGLLSDKIAGENDSRKQRPQLGSSPRQARHYRPCGAVQNRGYLLIRQFLEFAQQDYFPKIQR